MKREQPFVPPFQCRLSLEESLDVDLLKHKIICIIVRLLLQLLLCICTRP